MTRSFAFRTRFTGLGWNGVEAWVGVHLVEAFCISLNGMQYALP